jgi:ATP-binding protein involved in chromosome partitioning
MVTIEQVNEVLSKIIHPEYKRDIVSLEMIENIEISDKKIKFSLKLKKTKDPFSNSIIKMCKNNILNYLDKSLEIEIDTISPEIKHTEKENTLKNVKNIIAIASGKGGVGKSTIAANLAVSVAKLGYKTGIVDADIYGPSLPMMFGLTDVHPEIIKENNIDLFIPIQKYGVKIISIGFFVSSDDALVWRGPMASSALKQLLNQSKWDDLDYLFIDLPPGTSDIHLTLVQTLSVTGVVIVSTPQKVALADVVKGINMFANDQVKVPILGLVENMSWFTPEELPNNKYYIFGKNGCSQLTAKYDVPLLGQIPIVQSICEGSDEGLPVAFDEDSITGKAFIELAKNVINETVKRNLNKKPTEKVIIKK